ncbi:hypothetical protein MBLNU459_g1748t3 [Dothideomycetes sp. NU459]
MDSAHRKIELQAPADLTYLVNNATRAARAKLDLHFPPSAAPETGDDAMKKRVEELVDSYIQATFSAAKSNLAINGLSGADMEATLASSAATGEELEPYDTRLASRIQSLSAQIEALTLQLATARRDAPRKAAEAYNARVAREQEQFAQARQRAEKQRVEEATTTAGVATGAEEVLRWEEMRAAWTKGTTTLGTVKDGIGGTTARLVRAQQAARFLESK